MDGLVERMWHVSSGDGFGSALALAVGTGMDNFAVGAAFGCRGRRVLTRSNALIAGSNAATTVLTMVLGSQLLLVLSEHAASNMGACIFLILGLWDLKTALQQRALSPRREQKDKAGHMHGANAAPREGQPVGLVEAVPVALGLCFTNVAGGIAAGAAGLSIEMSGLLAFVCSVLLLMSGHALGRRMNERLAPQSVGLVSGVLLVLLGVSQLQLVR